MKVYFFGNKKFDKYKEILLFFVSLCYKSKSLFIYIYNR